MRAAVSSESNRHRRSIASLIATWHPQSCSELHRHPVMAGPHHPAVTCTPRPLYLHMTFNNYRSCAELRLPCHDTERKKDMQSLQQQLCVYRARRGLHGPSSKEKILNDEQVCFAAQCLGK